MTTIEFLSTLRSRAINLWVEGEQLCFGAPAGALTPALRTELRARKAELIAFLRQANPNQDGPPIRPAARSEPLPLSFAQQRLWFLHQLDPSSSAYHLPYALRLDGPLDLVALSRTLAAIVDRHETLRTSFVLHDAQPVQQIAPAAACPLRLCDLAALPAPQVEALVQFVTRAEEQRPFDLARGPLLRLALLRLAPDAHVLLLTMHHIIADGWSISVLIREVVALYAARGRLRDAALPALPIQYADYAIWQRAWLTDERVAQHLDYWQQALADAPPLLALLTDFPRPPFQTFHGAQIPIALPLPLLADLQALSRRAGATLFMTLLAVFQALLARWSGQDDLVVGSPIAGRTQAETEGLIGCFVNTLALRAELSGDLSFRALLEQVRERTLAAYTHQELPFELLVSHLHLERDPRYTPVVQTLFVFQNTPFESLSLADLTITPIGQPGGTAKFDLVLNLSETAQGLAGSLIYNTDLFEAATIERLGGQFATLLAGLAADPEQMIARLPLLSAPERAQLLETWSGPTDNTPDTPLHKLLGAQAARTPDAVALVCAGQQFSYAELERRANQLAHALRASGIDLGAHVGLCLTPSPELIVGLLGVLKAGAAYVPLDPSYPAERLAFMIADARLDALLTQAQPSAALAQVNQSHTGALPALQLRLDADWPRIEGFSAEPPPSRTHADALLYVIYTSGSTGRPKGAGVYQRSFCTLLRWFVRDFVLDADDRVLIISSFSFDLTQKNLFAPLLCGGQLHLDAGTAYDPARIRCTIAERRISWINCTPSAFYPLVEEVDEAAVPALASLRYVFLGGEPIVLARLRAWAASAHCRAQVVNTYGPTECTDVVASYRIAQMDDWLAAAAPIGWPVPNTALLVLDHHQEPLPIGVVGELYIGGGCVGLGYLNDPALTAERFVPNPFARVSGIGFQVSEEAAPNTQHPIPDTRLYRTGDLARYRNDGALVYLGRIDGQVKLRGFRVELGEIESVLRQHAEVCEAVVVQREDIPGERRLVAYVVPADEGRRTEDESEPSSFVLRPSSFVADLRAFLAARLPEYMAPSAFVLLDALPLTPSGKLDRKALPAPEQANDTRSYVAPRNELERQLVALWERVLGHGPVGLHDDFFALGGDSIRAAILANRLQQLLDAVVYVVALFDAPTVAALADYLRERYPDAVARLTGQVVVPPQATAAEALPALDEALVATMQQRLDASLPPALAPLTPKNPPALFVLSAPRSGSTLLRVMLAGHPGLFAPPELALLPYATMAERERAFAGRDAGWLEGLLRALMELHSGELARARQLVAAAVQAGQSVPTFYRQLQSSLSERMLVDKTTTYAASLHTLRRAEAIFTDARYIHLVRQPSAMIHSYLDSQLDEVFGLDLPLPVRTKAELIWLLSNRNIARFFEEVAPERRLQVRFEELVTQPEATMRAVCAFVGLAFEPAMLEPYQGARMLDAVRPESRMVGDPRFQEHRGIEAAMAHKGVALAPGDVLSAPTVALAQSLGYTVAETVARVATPPLRRYERTSAPLSFGQERLWFLHQLERSSAAYHLPYALRLCGVLDLGALARTLAAIVARHESLRTSFVVQDGTPMQQIAPAAACPLRLCDLATLPTAHAEALVQGLARAEAQRPFDLAGGPLLRLALLRLAPDAHVLLLTMHHIIADGWSIGVLIREVAALYAAHGSLTDAALLPLSIQYADYAIWQRAWLTDERLEQQLSYWRHTLADAPPLLALPTDYPRPPVPSFAGASQALALDQATVRALQALSQKHAATLFMTLLAAFQVLLARLSGQDDILIGSPIAGRTHAEAERLIGFFVNTLVLRTKLTATTSFAALLPQVRATCLQAYAHQELPFEQLVEALHPVRNLQVSPLFQVMFVLQNAPQSALELGDLTLQPLATPNSSAKFDLTLTLYETSQGLNGSLEYATTLFDATTIARLASHFRTLLGAVLATPEACIADLPLLSAAERSQLLHEWNDTTAEYPRDATIHAIFEAQAARLPDAVAVVYGGQALTYAALNQRANQLAHYLGTCGVGPEAVVGIAMPRSLDLPVGLLSILKAGGVYLPLDPDLPAQRLVSMLDNARVGTLLVSDQATVLHPTVQGSCTVVMLDRAWEQIAEQPAENPDLAIAADNLAYVMYTSGSSGQPKGVAIPHRGVLRLVCGNHYAQLRAACTLLQLAPIVFDASTFELWGMLLNGGHCVLLPEAVPTTSALQQAISAYGVSTLWLTATLFNKMVDQLPQALAGVQELLIGGEALSVAHVQRAQQALPQTQIINGYGPTESTTFACCYPIPSVMTLRGSSIPLGGPIANTTAYILDARLSLVPLGTAGELYLGGAGLARGYLGRPDLTAERFVPNPFAEVSGIGYRVPGAETSDTRYPTPATRLYRTGDLARWRADGTIEYLGRIDGQVKLRGYRIELGEIEATLVQHEEVQTCAMLLREDVPGERRLVAYVVPADEGRRTEDESEPSSFVLRPSSFVADLRAFLAERLPTYMIPSAFMLLDALPLTPNGKLDRRALPAPDMQASEAIFVAPRGENEELLAGIWAEVLRRERVGIHDEFFVVGGHSLLATQVIARIRQVFGVELPLRALFETPTVADLAARIATMQDIARQLGAQRDRVLEDVEEIEL